MPKIVDHDAHREELAIRAFPLFSRYGYHGLSTRKIAEELGVSKSGLFHYFPSKAHLFEACTSVFIHRVQRELQSLGESLKTPNTKQKLAALQGIYNQISNEFVDELNLIFNYTRDLSPNEIEKDNSMTMFRSTYRDFFVSIVGEKLADAVFSMIMGHLLWCHFSGTENDFSAIKPKISTLLESQRKE